MNGHVFNGRPCVVEYGSPYSVRRMGEAQVNKTQGIVQSNTPPGRRGVNEGGGSNMPMAGNYQGGDGNRSYGRGNWGRGNAQGMGGRGQGGPMRNRMAGMGAGRGIMGNGGGNGFGQGLAQNPQMMHPQAMMGQGFDPAYGPNMGRMGGYGGFPAAPNPSFPGMLPSFPPVGGVGLPGVAPHVNPAFFGRGMPANGMGMMPTAGMDGHGMGMWSDPGASGWGGEDPGGRVAESSYGEDAVSDHVYGDAIHDRGRPNAMKEKDRASERDFSGPPNRKYREDRDPGSDKDVPREKDEQDYGWSERRPHGDREVSRDRERVRDREHERERDRDRDRSREDRDRDRDRYREDRDRHIDHPRYKDRGPDYNDMDHHRYKDHGSEYDDEWDRGRSSRGYSKSRVSHEEDHRGRSRDVEYSKRRRLPSE
ncbi:hypothetical protein AQUCO_02200231v1 [Aquilegia coerulea]|uniref:RRM domain-containing protein n=1 Tax=Aquilegia coerulea TaxID=218851 RepID=A0A2G5DDV3_AQUCA|nr:hypothetical protein AQUCO_02200231v1 [Aquilegia coerulea]